MEFIKIETRLRQDVRFGRFARLAKMSEREALGTLVLVHFAWAQTETDILSPEDIDFATGCSGIAQALLDSGLAEKEGGCVRIKGARDALDKYFEGKAKGKHAADTRWARKAKSDSSAMHEHCTSNADACASGMPSEKIRKEEIRKEESGESGKPIAPAACGELAEYLLEAIRTHRPDHRARPRELAGWAREIDLALRRDSRTLDDLRRAIDWAHRSAAGTFWRPNLLSGKSLRKHAARILIEIDTPRGGGGKPRGVSSDELRQITNKLLDQGRQLDDRRLLGE